MPHVLFDATTTAEMVSVPARKALAYDGSGAPEGFVFQAAFGALYGVAYTLKFARKVAGADFKLGPLEGRWSASLEGTNWVKAPRESWLWRLRVAVPDDVTPADVRAAIGTATSRKGGKLENSVEARRVYLEKIPAERVGRALHVGPYATEGRTIDAIDRVIAEAGRRPSFAHIEVYLSDPRRTPPERLKTVLLRELR